MFNLPVGLIYNFLVKLISIKAIIASTEKVTERIRKSACAFQLDYADYNFSSSRLHKSFKESTDHNKERRYETMNDLLEAGLKKNFGKISQEIEFYFEETHRSKIKPRVGVHIITDDNQVVDVIQRILGTEEVVEKTIENYTVIETVLETGTPYKDNHIPKTVIDNEGYKHRGLNVDKIRKDYKLRIRDKKYFSRIANNWCKKNVDERWAGNSSYRDVSPVVHKNTEGLYKSHIVIPITFRRHAEKCSLNPEMIKVLKLGNEGRSIMGLLFIDHPDTYYFHDADPLYYGNIDINAMVMYADMISLVLMTKLMYTDGSRTVDNYLKFKNDIG